MAHQRSIKPGATRGTVFKVVARARLQDAKVLLGQKRYGGAAYLAGYAVECTLKWAITQQSNPRGDPYLPAEFETHDLDVLLEASGLFAAIRRDKIVWASFSTISEAWGPDLRYSSKEPAQADAEELYQEAEELYEWLIEKVAP